MTTRIEKIQARTADGVLYTLDAVFSYREYKETNDFTSALDITAKLDGSLPIEGWEDKDDLATDFHEDVQNELREYIVRFIESCEDDELYEDGRHKALGLRHVFTNEEETK